MLAVANKLVLLSSETESDLKFQMEMEIVWPFQTYLNRF